MNTEKPQKPSEAHLRLLRNLSAGKNELDGFLIQENGVRAFFECILYGWVSQGQLTDEGRLLIAS